MGGPADGRAMRDPDRHGIVDGVQIGRPEVWDPKKHLTGMRKQPVVSIDVADPGAREAGGRSGVAGDHVGDLEHHGGSEQAVYVVARQELEHWERELPAADLLRALGAGRAMAACVHVVDSTAEALAVIDGSRPARR